MKLLKQLSGIAGEYYVAAELSRRGMMAAITLRNADSIDILTSLPDNSKQLSIQVKSTQNKRRWLLTQKVENNYADNMFYIFVNIPDDNLSRPEFFVIHSKELADIIKIGHQKWLKTPGRNGKMHNDTNAREFSDKKGEYLENWKILGL